MSAPRRLLEDPSLSDALRDDLRVAAQAEPDYDAQRGLVALQAAVAALGPLPLTGGASAPASTPPLSGAGSAAAGATGAAATTSGTLGASSAKLVLAIATAIGLGTVGTVAWPGRAPAPPAAPVTAPAVVAPAPSVPAPQPQALQEPSPVLAPAADPTPVVTPAAEPPRVAHPRPHHVAPAPIDPDLALRAEIEHLARVKALLERDPRAAYKLAQAGNATLSSMFRQERDGLSVLALDAAGEHARARRLARSFLARHPDSPLRARIEALLAPGAVTP